MNGEYWAAQHNFEIWHTRPDGTVPCADEDTGFNSERKSLAVDERPSQTTIRLRTEKVPQNSAEGRKASYSPIEIPEEGEGATLGEPVAGPAAEAGSDIRSIHVSFLSEVHG